MQGHVYKCYSSPTAGNFPLATPPPPPARCPICQEPTFCRSPFGFLPQCPASQCRGSRRLQMAGLASKLELGGQERTRVTQASPLPFHSHYPSMARTRVRMPPSDFSIQQPALSFSSLCHIFPLQVTCPADHQDGRVTVFLGVGVSAWMTVTSCPRWQESHYLDHFCVSVPGRAHTWH